MKSAFIYPSTTSPDLGCGECALAGISNRILQLQEPMMRGDDVRLVQLQVGTSPDGIFGPKTKQAVINFQASHGLTPSGKVDSQTWEILEAQGSTGLLQKLPIPSLESVKSNWMLYGAGGLFVVVAGLGIYKRLKK